MRGQRVDEDGNTEWNRLSCLAARHLKHMVLDLLIDTLVLALLVKGDLVEVSGSRAELLVVVVGQEIHFALLLQIQTHYHVLG